MPIKPPKWIPVGAVPTVRGWASPSGEVYKVQRFSQAEISEWYAQHAPKAPEVPEPPKVEMLVEAPFPQTKLRRKQVDYFHTDKSVDTTVDVDRDAETTPDVDL